MSEPKYPRSDAAIGAAFGTDLGVIQIIAQGKRTNVWVGECEAGHRLSYNKAYFDKPLGERMARLTCRVCLHSADDINNE